MRKRYGSLFRFVVETFIEPRERVRAEFAVDAEEQFIDVYLDGPAPEHSAYEPLGWLGEMTKDRALLEAFHKPASARAMAECVMKQRALLTAQERNERRAAEREQRAEVEVAIPMLWIISAGDPAGAREGLGF